MDRSSLAGWLRLLLTPGLGRSTARRLLAAFGLPDAVFEADTEALQALLGSSLARSLAQVPEALGPAVEDTLAWLAQPPGAASPQASRAVIALGDPLYPPLLLATEDPPLLLFAQGRLDRLQTPGGWPRAVAIVGSRNPTAQGADHGLAFARSLAQAGLCVVSGMALGVDAAAHEGALQGGAAGALRTVAVLGTGLDRVYPARHADLAARIADQGLLLSEFLLGTPPLAQNFPQRNRIISGLAQGTLVVEATLRSGSLVTARMAAEQGREVFAIPGSVHAPQSRGCHALIRQGAQLVETAQDVLDGLHVQAPPGAAAAPAPSPGVRRDPVLEVLGHDPMSLDGLVARCGWPASALLPRLLELELEGRVARLPGGLFQRRDAA
ncbi:MULTISPECIES: DNA-processing protein DprA [Ramlibacter]|uniref:DNA-protecting protein DprA n=1 Tax=Ramlibacter aquaticus TaxID=2780094 RepID=A0ABR9SAL8_9BURK|nr:MULTISPECIES: DNA-processing protein DprA [Ramlibacter]MBE7939399.1 DNA-protecting protein DprA [Ramlibacter aquaticus]